LYLHRLGAEELDEVTKKTNGEVGYIHIPDMGQPGLNEFTKQYFPQIRRKGSSSMCAERWRLRLAAGYRETAPRTCHG
jgi:hypothetical protein